MLSEGKKRGFEVYIVREDGTRFPEHQIVQSAGSNVESSTTSCFLKSEEGRTFKIVINASAADCRPMSHWIIEVSVNGRRIRRTGMPKGDPSNIEAFRMISMEDGKLVAGSLTFSKLRTTDDESAVTLDTEQLHLVGQIVVLFRRGLRGKSLVTARAENVVQADVGVASELGKKLGGAVSSTSQKPYIKSSPNVVFSSYDDSKPFHRMTFNYRTRPVLALMNIVEAPRPLMPIQPFKRKRSGSDAKEGDPAAEDIKPDRKALIAARVKDLERQLEIAIAQPRDQGPVEIIDLTEEVSDNE